MTDRVTSWRAVLDEAAAMLASRPEARLIVEEVSGLDASAMLTSLDEEAPGGARERVAELTRRRGSGEPLQHVIGHWSFRTLELIVDARGLVPRPETEVVVGVALDELARLRARLPATSGAASTCELLAVDLGTGSGTIACSLVTEARDVRVVGVDISHDALALAEENRRRLDASAAERVSLVHGDWNTGIGCAGIDASLHGSVACLVANPPYIASNEWAGLPPVVRDFDPYEALVAGPTGVEAIEAVVRLAPMLLAPGGALVVEIAPHQARDAVALARDVGAAFAVVREDLAGRERVLLARMAERGSTRRGAAAGGPL